MILVIDVGNTSIVIAVYKNRSIISKFYINTYKNLSGNEYYKLIYDQLVLHKLDKYKFKDTIISSVVPEINDELSLCFTKITDKTPIFINSSLKSHIAIKIDNPSELGSDLLADCVGAKSKYGYPVIIADLGTANKILVIDDKGNYVGGIISPGIRTSLSSLVSNASMIADFDLSLTDKVIGKNTKDAINIGVLQGNYQLMKGLISNIKEKTKLNHKVIYTGGFARLIKPLLANDEIYDETLLIDGIYHIYNINFISEEK